MTDEPKQTLPDDERIVPTFIVGVQIDKDDARPGDALLLPLTINRCMSFFGTPLYHTAWLDETPEGLVVNFSADAPISDNFRKQWEGRLVIRSDNPTTVKANTGDVSLYSLVAASAEIRRLLIKYEDEVKAMLIKEKAAGSIEECLRKLLAA